MFLLFHSQHVSAQIGNHQVIFEEYTNDDGIHIKTIMVPCCEWNNKNVHLSDDNPSIFISNHHKQDVTLQDYVK
jgi:hypothetical protein